ncbi:translation initiation factor 1A [Nanobdella aerobiophila]|uniref:Translation initiation factor 1A n=1 Tax=Nanobdella aerobiophila TaxID=2586965 RepID=A0A915WRU4_9ARCH|nr:translation initiation factor eIF-1A [Nanobdella aerobiophila]BBL45206.1 translation initiation factor 1A [Nanobdella aerobiophila]
MLSPNDKGIPLPQDRKIIGVIEEVLGWAHARVRCFDGHVRICRVPQNKKLHKNIWLKKDTYVLVEPWELQSDKKGDILYSYSPSEVDWLKKNGYLKTEEEF